MFKKILMAFCLLATISNQAFANNFEDTVVVFKNNEGREGHFASRSITRVCNSETCKFIDRHGTIIEVEISRLNELATLANKEYDNWTDFLLENDQKTLKEASGSILGAVMQGIGVCAIAPGRWLKRHPKRDKDRRYQQYDMKTAMPVAIALSIIAVVPTTAFIAIAALPMQTGYNLKFRHDLSKRSKTVKNHLDYLINDKSEGNVEVIVSDEVLEEMSQALTECGRDDSFK